jgi:hypothetical protein
MPAAKVLRGSLSIACITDNNLHFLIHSESCSLIPGTRDSSLVKRVNVTFNS